VCSQLGLQICHFALLTSHPFLLVLRPSTRVFPDPSPSARLRVLPMWLESQLALPSWPQFIVVLPTWAQLLRACQTGLHFFLCPRLVPPRSWRPGSYPFRRPGVLRPQMPSRPDWARWAAGGRARSVSVGPAWLLMLPTWRCYAFCLQPGLSVIPTWKMSCSKSPQMLPIMGLPHWCSHTGVTNMDARVKVLPGAPIMYGCSRARPVPVHAPIATPPDRHRIPAAPPSSANTQ
jgi:hypothetical protein